MATESEVKTVTFGEDDCKLLIYALSDAAVYAVDSERYGMVRQYKRLREEIKARLRPPIQPDVPFDNPIRQTTERLIASVRKQE